MSRSRLFSALLALAFLAAGGAVFWFLSTGGIGEAAEQPGPSARAPLVETAEARRPEDPPLIRQTGFVQAFREVAVAFEVQGRIAMVDDAFRVGREVAEGSVLARIETDRLESALRRAEADLAAARARASEARQRFRRVEELVERGVSTESNIEEARSARDTAIAQVAVAEAAVEQAEIDLRAADVVAPFDAYVVERTASEGQIVSPGQAIGRLVRADRARLFVGLADREVRALGAPRDLIGAEVTIRSAFGSEDRLRTGTVEDVDVRIDPAARTTNLVVSLPDPFEDPPVRIGELVLAELPLQTDVPLTAVPPAAVKDGDTVWVVAGGGTLDRVRVDVVHRTDETVYLAGATELIGQQLMTTNLAAATEGTEVRAAAQAGEAGASAESGASGEAEASGSRPEGGGAEDSGAEDRGAEDRGPEGSGAGDPGDGGAREAGGSGRGDARREAGDGGGSGTGEAGAADASAPGGAGAGGAGGTSGAGQAGAAGSRAADASAPGGGDGRDADGTSGTGQGGAGEQGGVAGAQGATGGRSSGAANPATATAGREAP